MLEKNHQMLQERIANLQLEHSELEKKHAAVLAGLPTNHTVEQKRQWTKNWVVLNGALRKAELRLRQARHLLATADGDEHIFQKKP